MKKNQNASLAVTFITGILFGVSLIVLFSFTRGRNDTDAPVSTASKISVQDANTYFKNYFNSAAPSNAIFKGFALNREQLDALNNLLAENPTLAGFRVYMGSDNSTGSLGIVVGVNSLGKDVTTSIYRTIAGGSGPCPTICDANSSITAK